MVPPGVANTPWHPICFFGVLRTEHAVHLSPLDAERELLHKLEDSGARMIITTNLFGLVPKAMKLLAAGHVDRVIVCDDVAWGVSNTGEPVHGEFVNSRKNVTARGICEFMSTSCYRRCQ